MNLVQPFLDDIRETRSDASTWFIFADWLEEQDDPRAELVRLTQRLRLEPDHDDFGGWQWRVQELLARGVKPAVPTLTNSIGLDLALIPAGSFWMGSPTEEAHHESDEYPQHRVRISRPFYLGVTPVTQAQFQSVIGRNPARFNPFRGGTLEHPVEQVSYAQAHNFCTILSGRPEELAARRTYRLPTEAEWEYACRAGTTTPYHFGTVATGREANVDLREELDLPPDVRNLNRTSPVRSYPPNAWGLYDLHGNVWEWCSDLFGDYRSEDQVDPAGPNEGDLRVIRGGGWNSLPAWCRAARRSNTGDATNDQDLGFRVVCEIR